MEKKVKNTNKKNAFFFFKPGPDLHPSAAIFQAGFILRLCTSLSGKEQMEIPVLARMAPLFLSTPRCFLTAAWLGVLTLRWEHRCTFGVRFGHCVGKGVGSSSSSNQQFPALSFLWLPCNLPFFKHVDWFQMLLRLIRGLTACISSLLLSLMQ